MKRFLLGLVLLAAATAASAQLTLFENDNFDGRRYDVNRGVDNLGNTVFNDTASSAVIRRGTWELCEDAYFRGRCVRLGPGRYPSLGNMGLNDKVSSARDMSDWGATPPPRGQAWGGGARAILYSQPGLAGRSFVIDSNVVRNLGNTGFNDRASSLRVEQGYWMFCSDQDFGGTCLTFGPGAYPQLPAALSNRISSGRRISSDYPYRQNPDWGRGRR
jgi:hypothetical protein